MSKQIIKQPNGKYCLFSSIVDNVTHYNLEKEDIIETFVEEFRDRITRDVQQTISEIEDGGKPYYQFTKDYEKMLSTIENIHGKQESEKVNKIITE